MLNIMRIVGFRGFGFRDLGWVEELGFRVEGITVYRIMGSMYETRFGRVLGSGFVWKLAVEAWHDRFMAATQEGCGMRSTTVRHDFTAQS